MVDHAAQQHAVEARVRERQALDVPLQEFYAGMLAPADLDELAADVEASDLVARAAQEMRKSAGTAAKIDDPRTGAKPAQLDECIDEARARLRREYVILVRIGMGIEEGNLALLVLVADSAARLFPSSLRHVS